jgi:hypothetical protein
MGWRIDGEEVVVKILSHLERSSRKVTGLTFDSRVGGPIPYLPIKKKLIIIFDIILFQINKK